MQRELLISTSEKCPKPTKTVRAMYFFGRRSDPLLIYSETWHSLLVKVTVWWVEDEGSFLEHKPVIDFLFIS